MLRAQKLLFECWNRFNLSDRESHKIILNHITVFKLPSIHILYPVTILNILYVYCHFINHLNPIWLSGVPQGSILVYFMFYVIVGKASADDKLTTCRAAFPTKKDVGVHLVKQTSIHIPRHYIKRPSMHTCTVPYH